MISCWIEPSIGSKLMGFRKPLYQEECDMPQRKIKVVIEFEDSLEIGFRGFLRSIVDFDDTKLLMTTFRMVYVGS